MDQLTKKEKYLLKKQKKEEIRLKKIRQAKIKKIIFVCLAVIFTAGIIFVSINYFFNKNQTSNQGTSEIVLMPEEYDAGTVSMADGLIKRTYEIKNNGDGDLKIDKIRTSCMCTTATLKVADKKSPEFGMRNNSTLWSQKIAPGEIGYLEVIFDPAFHGPQGTGSIIRTVYLSTNDLQNKEIEVKLIVNIIP